jgi:hypothetical protein
MAEQLTLFGAPEPAASYGSNVRGRGDDIPVTSERELLWPAVLMEALSSDGLSADAAVALMERLYGDVPRRTRLKIGEVCRRLRCDRNTVHRHINDTHELAAVDVGTGSEMPTWRVYRASLILFLVRREFGLDYTRTDATADDAARISRAIARVRRNNNK